MQPINITEFRLLWWDLGDLTESKVSSWMKTAFRCQQKGCNGILEPPHEEVEYRCSCGNSFNVNVLSMASNGLICPKCKKPVDLNNPQLQGALEEELSCGKCGATKQTYKNPDINWKVKDLVAADRLYHLAGAWRNKWFNYTLNDFVFYDQRSVRVVPIQHSQDVEEILLCAKAELQAEVIPADSLNIFGKWHNGGFDQLWDDGIKFPKFIASDQNAQKAVLDTVKGSILNFVREANEKVLEKINQTEKIHKKTAKALLKKLDELRERDVWNVHADPTVQQEMDALEGLLQAQVEEA